MPGLPGIVIGRNNFATWGITNNLADTTDLYLEEFDEKKLFCGKKEWMDILCILYNIIKNTKLLIFLRIFASPTVV